MGFKLLRVVGGVILGGPLGGGVVVAIEERNRRRRAAEDRARADAERAAQESRNRAQQEAAAAKARVDEQKKKADEQKKQFEEAKERAEDMHQEADDQEVFLTETLQAVNDILQRQTEDKELYNEFSKLLRPLDENQFLFFVKKMPSHVELLTNKVGKTDVLRSVVRQELVRRGMTGPSGAGMFGRKGGAQNDPESDASGPSMRMGCDS